jgi:3-hydroxybutyryl-CoA dehydrogenase
VAVTEIRRLGVVGLGAMGSGIAQLAIEAGYETVGREVTGELAQAARARIAHFLQRKVDKELMAADVRESALGSLSLTTDLADLADCDLVIEAIVEGLDPKRELFGELEGLVRADAVLATNTSALSVTEIAAATATPERVVGMHFFNPVPVMALVEVIRGFETSDATAAAIVELARDLGKTPAEVRDFPGFVANRILMPLVNEAAYALMEGVAEAEAIDEIAKLGLNHPMGPLALADLIGLDTCVAIMEVLHQGLGHPKYAPCPLLRQYVQAGRLGRKSGRGFYDYPE